MIAFRLSEGGLPRWTIALIIAVASLALLLAGLPVVQPASAGRNSVVSSMPVPQSSYLFRFDPAIQTFYTFTLPIASIPYGVAVTGTNPTHVWVAEFGRNRIGHLIYTNTNDVHWTEYPVTTTANSGPFRITVHGNFAWFTERGANRIGRVNAATGQIDEFFGNGLSANSGLADIEVAPNGWVWAAGQSSNRLVRLVVTPTVGYAFQEYTHTLLVGPFDLAVESSNSIWFTSPDDHKIGRLTPSDGSVLQPFGFPPDSRPYAIVAIPANDLVWFSDIERNGIGQVQIGTLTNLSYYTPTMRPADLASESPTRFWFTQQSEQGAVGRFIYTSTVSTRFDSYPLPTPGLRPTGIAVASDKGVWFGAFAPARIFMPLVLKNASN